VFVTGFVENEPDIHERVIKSVAIDDSKDGPIQYQSISMSHKFWEKKSPKEHPSTDGILKSHWLKKHVQMIPSVVIMITNFCVDWPAGEWIRRESYNAEVLNKLRTTLNARDVKIVLIAVRTGSGMIDKDIIEERTNSMKKHFGLDGRNIMVMTLSDFNPLSPLVRRLAKTIRDLASTYYVSQCRRLRNIERMVRPQDHILIARYNFKVAFFYEFQNQSPRALRHYKHGYIALVDMVDSADDDMLDQVKAVAEMINFKICNIMLSSGVAKDAAVQFRSHVANFSSAFSGRPWKHYSWVSDQYIIYADILAKYNISSAFTDADRTFYFHNAALFALKRQSSFNAQRRASRSEESFDKLSQKFQGMKLSPPKHFGSAPQLHDPVLDQVQKNTDEVRRLIRTHVIDKEAEVNHTEVILGLLRKALDSVNPQHRRRRSHLRVLIAKQLMNTGSYDLASANLNPAIEFLSKEKWALCAIPVLRKKLACATYLGRPREYVPAALMLYAIAANSHMGKHDKEDLYRDIMSILTNTEKPTEDYLLQLRDGSSPAKTAGYVGLPLRPEYGAAATDGHPPEYFLPDGYVVDLADNSYGLFDVRVRFHKKVIEVGHVVRTEISVTSLLHGTLSFSDMVVHFTDDLILQTFYHDDSLCDDSEKADDEGEFSSVRVRAQRIDSTASVIPEDHNVSAGCLVFKPRKANLFTFDLFVPESSLSSSNDVHVCVEKLVMTMRVALPLKTSGEEITLEDEVSFQATSHPVAPDIAACMEELGIESIAEAQEVIGEIENDGFASMERARSISQDVQEQDLLEPNLVVDDSLDEVGDFLTAEPLVTMPSDTTDAEQQGERDNADALGDGMTPEASNLDLMVDDNMSDVDSIAGDDQEDPGDYSPYVSAVSALEEDTGEVQDDDAGSPPTAPVDGVDDTAIEDDVVEETLSEDVENSDPIPEAPAAADTTEMQVTPEVVPAGVGEHGDPAPVDVKDITVDDNSDDIVNTDSGDIRMCSAEPQLVGAFDAHEQIIGEDTEDNNAIMLPAQSPMIPGHSTDRASSPLVSATPDAKRSSTPPPQGEAPANAKRLESATPADKVATDFRVMRQRGYREVVFDVSALSREFREARQAIGKTQGNLSELSMFLGANGPKTLHITCPKPRVALLHPPANNVISILQGTIQRVNFIFHCGEDKIVNGKIFLSSSYTDHFPNGGGDFFWYPDLNPSEPTDEAARRIDKVNFHPMTLNDSFQPATPLNVPYQKVNSVFSCPVFIKSDIQGEVVMRLRVEYVPKGFLKTAVSHEFTQKFNVLKPFGMNFNITSINDPHCGVEKKHGTSVVLRGELVNVSASLDCVNSLGAELEISKMHLSHKGHRVTDEQARSMYEFAEATDTGDLLRTGVSKLPEAVADQSEVQAYVVATNESCGVILHRGEAYVGSVDLRCKEEDEVLPKGRVLPFREMLISGNAFKPVTLNASMGDVLVNWHIRDSSLLSPINVRDFVSDPELLAHVDDQNCDDHVGSWLLSFFDGSESGLETLEEAAVAVTHKPVNKAITRTRVCSMVFSIPEVQVSFSFVMLV
jgi:hypothetical protein